mmetsp:Transcript_45701/g.74548  ORF Transcript_45701/g.74548 Transcript_45701/m.74548 type:complete len:483 (-) Transcript_45701:484-1932(-)
MAYFTVRVAILALIFTGLSSVFAEEETPNCVAGSSEPQPIDDIVEYVLSSTCAAVLASTSPPDGNLPGEDVTQVQSFSGMTVSVISIAQFVVGKNPATMLDQRLTVTLFVNTSASESATIYFRANQPVVSTPNMLNPTPPDGSYFHSYIVPQRVTFIIELPECYSQMSSVWFYAVVKARVMPFWAKFSIKGTVTDCPEPANPSVFGDPHIRTFDGLTATYIGCGDVVMAESEDKSLMYQSRHCMRGNDASSTCAVALRCEEDADIMELYATGNEAKVFVGGKQWRMPSISEFNAQGLSIERSDTVYTLTCALGTKLSVLVREAGDVNYLDVEFAAPGDMYGKIAGLMGRWDADKENDISMRDGKIWNHGHGLDYVNAVEHPSLADVEESWRVQPEESLFKMTAKQSGAECTNFGNRKLMNIAQKSGNEDLNTKAMKACSAVGMSGVWLRTCMFDFIASGGDSRFVINHALAKKAMDTRKMQS